MPRRRYTSTDISTDKKFNQLVNDFGFFAGLLYELMIPHAEDDCTITADAEELRMKVVPGLKKITCSDIEKAINGIISVGLMFYLDEVTLCFPSKSFYKYQSYIPDSKRVSRVPNEEQRKSPQNTEEPRFPSPSPSPIPSPYIVTPFQAALDNFMEMRKKIKKPMTDKAKELLLKKLDGMASDDEEKIKILEQSIMNSWQGVFPLKQNQSNQNSETGGNIFFDKLKERNKI